MNKRVLVFLIKKIVYKNNFRDKWKKYNILIVLVK